MDPPYEGSKVTLHISYTIYYILYTTNKYLRSSVVIIAFRIFLDPGERLHKCYHVVGFPRPGIVMKQPLSSHGHDDGKVGAVRGDSFPSFLIAELLLQEAVHLAFCTVRDRRSKKGNYFPFRTENNTKITTKNLKTTPVCIKDMLYCGSSHSPSKLLFSFRALREKNCQKITV